MRVMVLLYQVCWLRFQTTARSLEQEVHPKKLFVLCLALFCFLCHIFHLSYKEWDLDIRMEIPSEREPE